jgi:hypothetical protein
MISEAQLFDLERTFRDRLPDDTGMAQLGILLIGEVRKGRVALVAAAIPLEVLAGQIRVKPYTELSSSLQDGLLAAVENIEGALESNQCCDALKNEDDEFAVMDIDPDAFTDCPETREYFQCPVNGEQHVFKFTLHPETGDFELHTFLKEEYGFLPRLWRGICYAFGYHSKYGHWDHVSMDRGMTERLHRLTNEALDTMQGKAVRVLHEVKS